MDLIVIYKCLSQETEFGCESDACVGMGVQAFLATCADIIEVKLSRDHWAKREKKIGLLFLFFVASVHQKEVRRKYKKILNQFIIVHCNTFIYIKQWQRLLPS